MSTTIDIYLNKISMKFETDNSLFSPSRLDKGTRAMLSLVELSENEKILDLGCGYGIVGIYLCKLAEDKNVYITMVDNDDTAIKYSDINLKLNNIKNATAIKSNVLSAVSEDNYTLILCNPPYHTDFSVAKRIIEESFDKLTLGGKLMMVTKRKDWYKNKLITVFGGVTIEEIHGYFVFISEKRTEKFAKKKIRNK